MLTNMNKAFMLLKENEDKPEELIKQLKKKLFIKENNLPKQLESKELFEYISNSKHYSIFKQYQENEEHKDLYDKYFHGICHVDNVTIFAYYICEKENYSEEDIGFIMEAARYHDIGRKNDWEEGNHGFAGAKKYQEFRKGKMSVKNINIVKFLISAHDLPNTNEIKPLAIQMFKNLNENEVEKLYDMANIIRDADALDRTRFHISEPDYLNPKYLKHNSAKEIIELAQILNYREKTTELKEGKAKFSLDEWIKRFDKNLKSEWTVKIGRMQEKYHNFPVVDVMKELSKESIEIIKKLGIKIENRIYTEYEFDVLEGEVFDYYEYEGMEDRSYLKSLEGTGVSREDVSKVIHEIYSISEKHNF